MPENLTDMAVDMSTFVVACAFTDEDGDAVTPTAIVWSLTDEDGTAINARTDVAVAVPASTINIVLSGDDLKHSDGSVRVLTVEALYDSTLGTDLPLKDSVRFAVEDLIVV